MKLPKSYDNPHGNYPEMVGKPKLSYSAYTAFKEQGYRGEFFGNYFLGIRGDGNIFTTYGSGCGKYFEDKTDTGVISDFDKEVLDKIERPVDARYEVEVVIDRDTYCIQGYVDIEYDTSEGLVLKDLKTGAISSKEVFYASELYQQTTLYAYKREQEGKKIADSGVILADRKGNGNPAHPLRLTGQIKYIPTPYSTERAELFLKDFDKTAAEIEKYYLVYLKYFTK